MMESCVSGSVCFELVKGVPAALVAVAVAIPTVFIAFRQYFLAKAKVKLDLFERRMAVYRTVYDGFVRVPNVERGDYDDLEWDAVEGALKDGRFLFGTDIREYIEEMLNKWGQLGTIHRNKKADNGQISAEDRQRERVLTHWFLNEASNGIYDRFGKYLSFEEWH